MSSQETRHLHGGDPFRDFARFGLEPRPVIDFSANLSPLGPPARVQQLWPELWRHSEHYPSLEGKGVAAFYERRFGLTAESVLAGNGATELIYLAPRALGFRRAAVMQPAYDDYRRACQVAGVTTLPLELSPDDDFQAPSLDHWRALLGGPWRSVDAIFLGQPNNPTGTLMSPGLLRQLAAEWPKMFWLIDESFIQFTDAFPESSLAFGGELPANVLVFHSLTKFYALAGLRLGSVIAQPQTLAVLRAKKEPWTINGIAEQVAGELVNCGDYEQQLRELIRAQRTQMQTAIDALPGFKVFPGTANFLLIRTEQSVERLQRRLLSRGFCVRGCGNFPGLGDGYFRVAVRGEEENAGLLAALRASQDLSCC